MKKKYILACLAFNILTANAQDMPTIDIIYNGNTASVNIPSSITDVTSSVNGAKVTLSSDADGTEYCYRVRGSSDNGSLRIIGDYKLTLELAGLSLNCNDDAAINIAVGKRIAVVLDEGTVNTLSDCTSGSQKAAMYFSGHPEFEGGGTLNVTGKTGHAISAKEYLQIKKSTGVINILGAVKDGIHCGKGKVNNANNYFQMDGGIVNINNVGDDCVDSDNYGIMTINDGELNINVSKDGAKGMKCYSNFTMTGGTINTNLTAGDIFDEEEQDYDHCTALSVGGNFIMSDGSIIINRLNDEAKAYKITGNMNITDDANITLLGSHFAVNPNAYRSSSSIYAVATYDDINIADYSYYHLGAFVGSECRGNAEIRIAKDGTTYLYIRAYSNSEDEKFSFRLYNASAKKEKLALSTIPFYDNDTWATPSSPTTIPFVSRLVGDVNNDGHLNIKDLTDLVQYINGKTPTSFNNDEADANFDSSITVEDAFALEERILVEGE